MPQRQTPRVECAPVRREQAAPQGEVRHVELIDEARRELHRLQIVAARREHLEQHEKLWRPLLRARGALDADWEWLRDFDRDEWRLEFETYALIEPSGLVHGLITLELLADVVYVEGLAAAPWNREGPVPRQILGCGSELMKHAVRVSLARGYEGRLALHSLEDPSTVNFYRQRIRMTELRVEPVGETMLRYFELSSKQALMLIGVDEP